MKGIQNRYANINLTSYITLIKCILCIGMIMIMFVFSGLFDDREIIFPETLALCIGAWYSKKQPWIVNKLELVLLMTLSSITGVCIVRYLPDILLLKISVGFFIIALILMASRATLYPIISACILPIMLNTKSLVYCASVLVLSTLIVLIQFILEKCKIRQPQEFHKKTLEPNTELICWGKRYLIYIIISIISLHLPSPYLITPPLIVLFAELSNTNSPLRKKPFQLVILFTCASAIGIFLRLVGLNQLAIPAFICAGIGTLLLMGVMQLLHLFAPPAGAAMLLAFLLPEHNLVFYPIYICCGTILFLISSLVVFSEHKETDFTKENITE